jgi:hypothetical protein
VHIPWCVPPSMAGTPAILQQAAATQLLLVQAPVPVEMLREDGVLKRLLRVTTQLAAFYMPEGSKVLLQVPASVMDLSTGHMSVTPGTTATLRTTLVGVGASGTPLDCLSCLVCCSAMCIAECPCRSCLSLHTICALLLGCTLELAFWVVCIIVGSVAKAWVLSFSKVHGAPQLVQCLSRRLA